MVWFGLVRPSAKGQTPDLRRHPSRHLRTRCNVLRLEFRLVTAPSKKSGGKGEEPAAPTQVDSQPRTQPRKLTTISQNKTSNPCRAEER